MYIERVMLSHAYVVLLQIRNNEKFKKLFLFSTIFFETNIMSDLSWTLCEQMELAYGLAKVSIE
jgi:hypothetical protein